MTIHHVGESIRHSHWLRGKTAINVNEYFLTSSSPGPIRPSQLSSLAPPPSPVHLVVTVWAKTGIAPACLPACLPANHGNGALSFGSYVISF